MTGFILLLLAMAVGTAVGHIEMMTPPPINSKFDPQTPESQIDFSMTSPLNADGSNYPCKGYNTAANIAALNSVATLEAGSTLTTNFSGTATHGGGSCQFALSYDGGETFAVIHSVMAGCPLATEYEVPIPSDAPTMNKALFAWTWYNKIGNREEYMNCAVVDVKGTSTKAFTAPALFRANTLSDGTCITVEGTEVVFPNPGDSVEFGGSDTSSSPATDLSPCSFNENENVTVGPSGSSTSSSGSSSSGSSSSSSSDSTTSKTASTSKASSTSTRAVASTTAVGLGVVLTSSTATAAQSTSTSGSSESESTSSSGTSTTTTSASTSHGSATLLCTSTSTFSLCAGSDCTPMGSVAAGTECVNGSIVASTSSRKLKKVKVKRRAHGRRSLSDWH